MGHPYKLLRILFGIVCIGLAGFLALAVAVEVFQPREFSAGMDVVVVVASIVIYCALFALWVYWLRYFWRTSQSKQFWICLFVPYLYAAYTTAKQLRVASSDVA